MTLTQQAHHLITEHFGIDSNAAPRLALAVDATCGNGHDTLFLLNCGFAHVLAFDVQANALDITRERCKDALSATQELTLIHASHSELAQHLYPLSAGPSAQSSTARAKLDCVMFNLGYLPNANKAITTRTESTLQALEQACSALSAGGLITIICYPGHANGAGETQAISDNLARLVNTQPFAMIRYNSAQASATTPILFALSKQ